MKLRAGCLLPWTRAPYGYRLDPDRPRDPAGVTVELAEAAVVQELFTRFIEDHASLFSLARHLRALGVASPTGRPQWSPTTLRSLLTNPCYAGQVFAGRQSARAPRGRRSALRPVGRPSPSMVPVPADQWLPVASVPALVTTEQLAQAQAKLAQNRAFARRHNTRHQYLLRALVSCGLCRSGCLCRTLRPGYGYYICRAKGDPITSGHETPCPAWVMLRHTSWTRWSGRTCVRCSPPPSRSLRPLPVPRAGDGCPRSCRPGASSCTKPEPRARPADRAAHRGLSARGRSFARVPAPTPRRGGPLASPERTSGAAGRPSRSARATRRLGGVSGRVLPAGAGRAGPGRLHPTPATRRTAGRPRPGHRRRGRDPLCHPAQSRGRAQALLSFA